jgi:hypothetical protein
MKSLFYRLILTLALFVVIKTSYCQVPTRELFEARVGKLTASPAIVITNKTDVVLKNLDITTTGERAIDIRGCTNVTVINCRVNKAIYRSINIEQCVNVNVSNNFCDSVAWGVYINQATGKVKCDSNWLKNIWGMKPTITDGNQGCGIMLNNSTLTSGASISFNYNWCEVGKGSMQDIFSVHNSKGTAANKIKIYRNYSNGGGPSQSSGGILCGDNGGYYITAEENVLINPGQYGIASMGTNNEILNNKIYAKKMPFTNVGIVVWQPIPAIPCANNKVLGNQVNWTCGACGGAFWFPASCSGTMDSGNNWQSAINETEPPPAGVPVPVNNPICPPAAKKIVTNVYDQNGTLMSTTTINL